MTFQLTAEWLPKVAKPSDDELTATMAHVRIMVGQKNVSEYVGISEGGLGWANEQPSENLRIPAYFLAEWMAENWWSLLYEPKKTEDGDDANADYDARHSILAAEHGFALPNVRIEPSGALVSILCGSRQALLAGVKFKNSASEILTRDLARSTMWKFISTAAGRLDESGISGTPLQKAWGCVQATSNEEEIFCRLVGALGLNPYDVEEEVARIVDVLFDALGESAALDACMASTAEDLLKGSSSFPSFVAKLNGPHLVDLSSLRNMRITKDTAHQPPWRWGNMDAKRIRAKLDISDNDPSGVDKFFEKINLDISASSLLGSENMTFSAGVDRNDECANIVLTQDQEEARRFAACRAFFLAMTAAQNDTRLVTRAVSRDQQASRAFAAELLVPSNYIKEKTPTRRISRDQAMQIGLERKASFEAVKHQIENNGIVLDRD